VAHQGVQHQQKEKKRPAPFLKNKTEETKPAPREKDYQGGGASCLSGGLEKVACENGEVPKKEKTLQGVIGERKREAIF